MKTIRILLPISFALFSACNDSSTSPNGNDSSSSSTTITSSSGTANASSSSIATISSSSISVVSSSSTRVHSSSSTANESSSSENPVSSSSSASSSASTDKPEALFTTRVPDSTEVTCGESGKIKFSQEDWICSFKYSSIDGYFYIQSSPKSCTEIMGAMPNFTTDKAELYLNGKTNAISSANYDWGGNHHNDALTFTYDGKVYKYYHSSFGFGWRSCQDMDCLQVYESDGTTLIEDGCTSSRAIPVVCRQANADGTFDSFTDTFEKCYGDDEE